MDDWYEIGYNRVLTVTAPGVLANDIDADGDELDANPLTPPQHGMTVFYPDGAFIYTPLDGFSGTDSFTYRVHDGFSWSDPATITIEVGPPAGYTYDWVAAFGRDSFDYANDVTPTSDGGFAAVGVTAEGNYESVYVVKVDGDGNLLWENQFSLGNYAERGFDIEETQDGGLIVFATAYIPNTSNFRPWLLKLDADGNRLWSTEDGLTQELDVKSGIIHGLERPDGGFVIAGGSNSLTSFQEAWVATVSITGTLESFTTYPPSGRASARVPSWKRLRLPLMAALFSPALRGRAWAKGCCGSLTPMPSKNGRNCSARPGCAWPRMWCPQRTAATCSPAATCPTATIPCC